MSNTNTWVKELLRAAPNPSSKVLRDLIQQVAPYVEDSLESRSILDFVHPNRPQLDLEDARSFLGTALTPGLGAFLVAVTTDREVLNYVASQCGDHQGLVVCLWRDSTLPLEDLLNITQTPEIIKKGRLLTWASLFGDLVLQKIWNEPLSDLAFQRALEWGGGFAEGVSHHPDISAPHFRTALALKSTNPARPDDLNPFAGYLLKLEDASERAAKETPEAEASMEALGLTVKALASVPDRDVSWAYGELLKWGLTQRGVETIHVAKHLPKGYLCFVEEWDLDEDSIRLSLIEAREYLEERLGVSFKDSNRDWDTSNRAFEDYFETEEALAAKAACPSDLLPTMCAGNLGALTRCLGDNPDEWRLVASLLERQSAQSIETVLSTIRRI